MLDMMAICNSYTNGQLVLQAETLPATTPKLLKQSSSLKEKYAKMKIHLADLTTEVKSRTKKSKNNRPAPEHPEESNSRTGNNLERGNSWQAAAKAVKGGFSRRKSEWRLPPMQIAAGHVVSVLHSNKQGHDHQVYLCPI